VGDRRGRPSSGYRGGDGEPDTLAVRLGEVARALHRAENVQDTLDAIVRAAVDTVPGAWQAGISEVEARRRVRTTAATHPVVREVDQAQYDTGEGPCLTSLYDQSTVRLASLPEETRWPTFTHRVADLGIRSMLSFQLYVDHGDLGALNLYSRETGAFTDESEEIGLLFAAHAGMAMADAQKMAQLSHAVLVRELIGQAKGILMERHRVSDDQAFRMLVRVSQDANVKLVEVARYLTETGELRAPR
jgi:GAF domain-containing protein